MRSMVVVFYLQDWTKGINDPPEAENYPSEVEVKIKVKVEVYFIIFPLRN
jgi:hypothetical protein